jgi:hypothetical protein
VQDKITKCLGLVTQYNPLTVAPGALRKANDCMIRREHIIEDRRGYASYASFGSNVSQLLTYLNRVLVLRGTSFEYDNGTGTFAAYTGTYTAPAGAKMRGIEAFSNLYATTTEGIKVFSTLSSTAARRAGAPRALDPSYALSGTTGFLANNSQCAYRSVIRRTDTQSNVVTGYPSQRLWVVNSSGGGRNVTLTSYLPTECVVGDIVQFYRTSQFATGTGEDAAGDEMGLVYQYELTATEIAAGFIQFTDLVTDTLRGATLYTSPSQEGISQANERPPLCKDLTLYKSNFNFYANCSTKQRLTATLVGAGSLTGKTITLGGVTYNFGATEILSGAGSPQIKVSSTGVAAVDIDETARSLVRVVNRYSSNTAVYAYYLTGPGDLPGQILFEEKGIGAAAFTLQASDSVIGGMFFPAPPVSPSTNIRSTSTNQVQKNAVYFSKAQQPEHVPLLNYLLVGPSNKEILRIVNLRDSAIVIKEEGVYRISGETPQSFTVVPVDMTVFCKAANSVVVLANQVFMLSNQGIVSISESGVQVISREIEPNLTPLLTSASLADYTTGWAYESERSYFLSTITDSSDTAANQTFVYNIFTRTWVRHTYAAAAAIVEPGSDKMYFAKPSSSKLFVERKSFTDADYADPEIAIAITALGVKTMDFTISGTAPLEGWAVSQNGSDLLIESLGTIAGGYRATMTSEIPSSWTVGAAVIYPSVGMEIEWHEWTNQNPDVLKQASMVGILADDLGSNSVSSLAATFRTNFDNETEEVEIAQPRAGWGSSWGSTPWGGGGDSLGYPTYVPMNKQYCTRLNVGVRHKNAREKLSIAGVAFSFRAVSNRIGR